MNTREKIINVDEFIKQTFRHPKIIRNKSEISKLNLRKGDILIRVAFREDDVMHTVKNGYSIYFVSDKDISTLNFPEIDKTLFDVIKTKNSLYAYEIPPMNLDYDKLSGGLNFVASEYIKALEAKMLTSDIILNDLKKGAIGKVHNSLCTQMLNTKLEKALSLLTDTTFINSDGVVLEAGTMYHKNAIVQLEFNIGDIEKVIQRKVNVAFNDKNLSSTKMVKAYLTSEPEDKVYPNLICIVSEDSIVVKPIVSNKPYIITKPFTCNVEIAYDYQSEIIKEEE